MGVVLWHGRYPMAIGYAGEREQCLTMRGARRRVHAIYHGQVGWWFQILRNGKEVWSSDHEIAERSK